MQILTRNEAAKKLRVKSTHLLYWERKGELNPEKVTVGSRTLFAYTPDLIEKARKILSRNNRRKRERKLKNERRR